MSEYTLPMPPTGPMDVDPRVRLVDERLAAVNERLDAIEERLDAIEALLKDEPPAKKKGRSGKSPDGICVVTGKPSGDTCEHFSTYRYQQGCGGACKELGRAYYRQYYYDRNNKSS